jgi:Ca2+-binding EF-hand superfamily protein
MDNLAWSNIQRESTRLAFNLIDDKDEGKISLKQVQKMLEKLNVDVTEEELNAWVKQVFGDDCDEVDFEQVVSLLSTKQLVRQTSVVSSGKSFTSRPILIGSLLFFRILSKI